MAQRFKTNMNALKNEQSNFEQGGGNNWMKLVDGKNIIRILPPWSEEGMFFKKVGFHRPPGRIAEKVTCPNFTSGGETCPICKKGRQVFQKQGKDVSKHYLVQKRAYLNVLDMKKADGVVYILECGPSILNPILNFMSETDSDDLVDPNKGFNILINRKNDGGFTKYEPMVMPKVYDLAAHNYNVDDILNNLNDLNQLIKNPEPDDFYDILDAINTKALGGEEGPMDDDDDIPQPAAPQPAAQARPAQAASPQPQAQPMQRKAPAPAPAMIADDDDIPQGPTGSANQAQAAMGDDAPMDIGDIEAFDNDLAFDPEESLPDFG